MAETRSAYKILVRDPEINVGIDGRTILVFLKKIVFDD
jgi:hypothetical protein